MEFQAEDRGLLSSDETFVNSYSVGGLFERLREDQAHNPDTMDQRYGAWARLLVLFRLIYQGARHGKMSIPGRKGYLFDPDRYPFLEGRPNAKSQEIQIPRVPDGVLYRVLTQLLVLDGERLSYRNLDVEQIGSVYEAMMGFELHVAKGPSIALKPKKRGGAPITINLSELEAIASAKRNDWLNKEADQKVTGQAERALKEAASIDDLMAALDKRIAKNVTPTIVPVRAMIFQPSAERRRSGSHYTPRSLTQPIVEAALAPVLKNLGENPKPEQILALKVCDPAMGSGAFLVEACRQLGDALVQAWHQHNDTPILPPDEDELLHARRLVAQRCLYGVDKNVMAVDLAKLSLWLATLARDHEFTFLDHALRHGDSLLGLSARQIAAFDWEPNPSLSFLEGELRRRIGLAAGFRKRILEAREGTPYAQLAQQLADGEGALGIVRNVGDVLAGAFFAGDKPKTRQTARLLQEEQVKVAFGNPPDLIAGIQLEDVARALRQQVKPVVPFHWELEFPEVFGLDDALRPQDGFDVIVGNPPFAGKNTIVDGAPDGYIDWLKMLHAETHGNADLVAHFFRRAFGILRPNGCFGLIATNTIAQGDTRSSGLRWICMNGGTIYRAIKRYKWPGEAAVIVSVIHIAKGIVPGPYVLANRKVDRITAYLFHAGENDDAVQLEENSNKSFAGSFILGMGFTFDDTDKKNIASSLAEMHRLIDNDPHNTERIFPFIGGEEINTSPNHAHHRYVINFGEMSEAEAREWPELMAIVEERVKPSRMNDNRDTRKKYWWRFAETTPALFRAMSKQSHVLAQCRISSWLSFVLLETGAVFDISLNVFPIKQPMNAFPILQSRIHEVWARFMASSMKDDIRYTPSDCFETFAFPNEFEHDEALEKAGRDYYDFRSSLMIRNNEGLTGTYNRFHRPDDQSLEIARLRELHEFMDQAVLEAYGWKDLKLVCGFFPEFDDEDDDDDGRPDRARRKKYRYRWPDDVHDEVLARLLALNRERATLQAPSQRVVPRSATKTKVGKKPKVLDEPVLF